MICRSLLFSSQQQRLRRRSVPCSEKAQIKNRALFARGCQFLRHSYACFLDVCVVRILGLKLYAPLSVQSQPRERLCIPRVTAVCSFIIRCAPPPVAPLPHLKYFLFLHLFIPSASNACKISHQNFNLLLFSSYLKFLFLSVRENLT